MLSRDVKMVDSSWVIVCTAHEYPQEYVQENNTGTNIFQVVVDAAAEAVQIVQEAVDGLCEHGLFGHTPYTNPGDRFVPRSSSSQVIVPLIEEDRNYI